MFYLLCFYVLCVLTRTHSILREGHQHGIIHLDYPMDMSILFLRVLTGTHISYVKGMSIMSPTWVADGFLLENCLCVNQAWPNTPESGSDMCLFVIWLVLTAILVVLLITLIALFAFMFVAIMMYNCSPIARTPTLLLLIVTYACVLARLCNLTILLLVRRY